MYSSPPGQQQQQQQAFAQQPPPMEQFPAQMQQIQPQSTQGMAVVAGGNRNAKNLPVNADKKREWSNGLCDCCDDAGTCLCACFCPCIVYSQVKQRVEYLNEKDLPDPEEGGGNCSTDCWVHMCLTQCCALGWVLQIFTRGKVRDRYRIEGGGCTDCLAAACCTPCELTQASREIELEEQSFGPRYSKN